MVTIFVKKIVRKLHLAEKIVCFKVMKGKNCLQSKGNIFLKYIDILKF